MEDWAENMQISIAIKRLSAGPLDPEGGLNAFVRCLTQDRKENKGL